jgi:hypothetical protein
MNGRRFVACVTLLLLAGCLDDRVPPVPEPPSDEPQPAPPVTTMEKIGRFPFGVSGPQATTQIGVDVPEGAKTLRVFVNATRAVGTGLAYELGQCAAATATGSVFFNPGIAGVTEEVPFFRGECPAPPPGPHRLRVSLAGGVVDGYVEVAADVERRGAEPDPAPAMAS